MDDINTSLTNESKKLEEFAKTLESTANDIIQEKERIDKLYLGTKQVDEKITDLKALKIRAKKALIILTKFHEKIKPHIEPMYKDGLKNVIQNVGILQKNKLSISALIKSISSIVPDTEEEIQEKIQEKIQKEIIQKIKQDKTEIETLSYFESNIDKIDLSTLRKIAIHMKLANFKKENFKTRSEKIQLIFLLKKHISTLIKNQNKKDEGEGEEDEGEEDEEDEEDEGEEDEDEDEEDEDEEDEDEEGEKVKFSDILTFFEKCNKAKNDYTNKVRENILNILYNLPLKYLENKKYGSKWKIVYDKWNNALKKIAEDTDVGPYTYIKIKTMGGRKFNYDVDVMYYNGTNLITNRKIEFKNGGSNIGALPQFLSLQAKIDLFSKTYDRFWYDNYLDKYLELDTGITEAKPPHETYLKIVTSTKSGHPFFAQLKNRESTFKKEKNEIVNISITDYLKQYGDKINIKAFSEKVKTTQKDKIYLLWCNQKFFIDKLSNTEMDELSFHRIKNGNVIQLITNNRSTVYSLLLRWRNHKGILNPAWQISMQRI